MRAVVVCLIGIIAGCTGGSSTCVTSGTALAVTRTNGTGSCTAEVLAGLTGLNQVFTPAKDVSCGVIHLTLTTTFFDQNAAHDSCTGTDTIAFTNFMPTNSTGTDDMSITCTGGIACDEMFDISITPK